ncbi:hypothetical protein M404DRAFT_327805 [Pisolithus tinctorius Marx 270]|uniref:Uncharacterized protein n=1 Tax=Pisolithus tinctorius Marx 270 TaxID=870435 RepID=A0A0C3P6C9_PISTI|nr:hypothetical protein M404DRAFT_327805 [Pisolithus tinctorius Marx 270]
MSQMYVSRSVLSTHSPCQSANVVLTIASNSKRFRSGPRTIKEKFQNITRKVWKQSLLTPGGSNSPRTSIFQCTVASNKFLLHEIGLIVSYEADDVSHSHQRS